MRQPLEITPGSLRLLAALIAFACLTGVGFASWLDNGTRIFMALAETGLAWCF